MKKTDKISLLMIIVLIFILAGGCDKNDTKMPYSCDPHAVCDNISKNEWTYLGLGDKSITSVTVHPCNPQVIFAGSSRDGKIFRSR